MWIRTHDDSKLWIERVTGKDFDPGVLVFRHEDKWTEADVLIVDNLTWSAQQVVGAVRRGKKVASLAWYERDVGRDPRVSFFNGHSDDELRDFLRDIAKAVSK